MNVFMGKSIPLGHLLHAVNSAAIGLDIPYSLYSQLTTISRSCSLSTNCEVGGQGGHPQSVAYKAGIFKGPLYIFKKTFHSYERNH